MSDRDDPRPEEDRALLEGLSVAEPPDGFADRVLSAWAEERSAAPVPARAHRAPGRRRALTVAAAAGLSAFVALAAERTFVLPAVGSVEAAARGEVRIGSRGVAVVEPGADLSWSVGPLGGARVVQASGSAFYRVEEGGPFVVETPAGEVRVLGTCFSVEVREMSSEAAFFRSSVKGALTGAVATALVLVTVHEGRIVLGGATKDVELAFGERGRVVQGGEPEKLPPAVEGELARLRAERGALRAQVAALESRLKDALRATANGGDPVALEIEGLRRELAAAREELAVEQQLRAEREGGAPIPFPEGISDAYREDALVEALRDAIAATGVKGEVTAVDCGEFPCIVYGELELPPGDEDVAAVWKQLEAHLGEVYAPAGHDFGIRSSTFREQDAEGVPHAKNHFGFSVLPKGSVDEDERGALNKRVRFRNNQYFDATIRR